MLVRRGLVPLHNACSYGHYEVAELLVRHGASVNVADLWKFTPLHEAAAKGKYEICKLLLKVSPARPPPPLASQRAVTTSAARRHGVAPTTKPR